MIRLMSIFFSENKENGKCHWFYVDSIFMLYENRRNVFQAKADESEYKWTIVDSYFSKKIRNIFFLFSSKSFPFKWRVNTSPHESSYANTQILLFSDLVVKIFYSNFFFIELPKLMKNKNMKEKHLWSFKMLYIFWLLKWSLNDEHFIFD